MKLHNSKALSVLPLFFAATRQTVLARINTPSSGYDVYGVNMCGYEANPFNKTDIDVHFYLGDNDIVQANVTEGGCHHFGHTTKEQPEFSTKGKGVDIPATTKWPDAYMCKNMGKKLGEMLQEENFCVGVEFPENACVVVLC